MFSIKKKSGASVRIAVITPDQTLAERVRQVLTSLRSGEAEIILGSLSEHVDALTQRPAILIVAELTQPAADVASLERLIRSSTQRPPSVIVIGDGLDETTTRSLLRLGVADWLSRGCSNEELINAARRTLTAPDTEGGAGRTMSVAFMPAIGGAGATTLSIAAMQIMGEGRRGKETTSCIVDLNFQNGTVADYLDLQPSLDLEEILGAPERLDAHLLEVMLSKHKKGYAALAAVPLLTADERIDAEIVGRILDLAASQFGALIIDMPPVWRSWCDNVVRGVDKFFFVADMSVAGLRHARQLAQLVSERCAIDLHGSVIVNKATWFGVAGVKKQHAQDLLGGYLGGFVPDCGNEVQTAQNEGALPSGKKLKSALEAELKKLSGKIS